jgi:hypothetical protein
VNAKRAVVHEAGAFHPDAKPSIGSGSPSSVSSPSRSVQ